MSALPKRTGLRIQEKPVRKTLALPSQATLQQLSEMLLENKNLVMFECECGLFMAAQSDKLMDVVIGNHKRNFCKLRVT